MSENLPDTNVGNIDYIRREDAVDAVCTEWCGNAHDAHCDACAEVRRIKALPSANVVQVVHAKWENYSPITIKCSRCGHVIHDWRFSECKYCPNCGAKMDGERKE